MKPLAQFVSITILIAGLTSQVAAQPTADSPKPIVLWPKGAPGEKGDIGEEHDTTKPTEGLVAGKRVIRLGNVSNPTIAIYRPPADKDTGAAIIVCPGGAYRILAMDLEGTEVCEWLNTIGVTGVLLKYRVPSRAGLEKHAAALQDAQRALSYVRFHAAEWSIATNRIGILGFSAGGHLSAAASTAFGQRTYETVDEADAASCRPDFALLIYPAYLAIKEQGEKIAPELTITDKTPPTVLVQTEDDGVRMENSLFYYLALKQAHVPAEMHLYADGGHGYGLRHSEHAVSHWPARAEEWLRGRGILTRKN
jgi:acetyl esterase/lipase